MPGTAPYEIVVGPAEIYYADVGTTHPDVDTAPGAGWTLLGTAGSENQSEDGVMIRTNVTSVPVRVAGSVMPKKFTFTEKAFQIEAVFYDLNPEELVLALGGDVDDVLDTNATATAPGHQSFSIPTDAIPVQKALLVRVDQSPFGADLNMQFNVFAAFQVGNPELVFKKGDAVGVRMTWEAVQLANGDFVDVVIQDSQSGT